MAERRHPVAIRSDMTESGRSGREDGPVISPVMPGIFQMHCSGGHRQ